MSTFGSAITLLSCSLFVASIVKLIAPLGKTEKILKLVISLFVLICLATCVKTVADEFSLNDSESAISDNIDTLDDSVNQSVLKVTADYMVDYVENLLSENNISTEEIIVTVDTDAEGVIKITDICIYIDKSYFSTNKINEIIEKDLKIIPRVVINE